MRIGNCLGAIALAGAMAGAALAAQPTELRDEKFQLEREPGGVIADTVIPPDFSSLERFYVRLDCGQTLEFAVRLEWEFARLGEPVLDGGPFDLEQACTPDQHAELDVTPYLHKSLRPGDDLRIRLRNISMEVEYRAVVMDYEARVAEGIAGAPGRDGVDGKDGRDGVNGVHGRDGKDGKNGRDGKDCDCDSCKRRKK